MRKTPEKDNEYDQNRLLELNAKPWQIELLDLNPEYVFWGNYEDYMGDKKSGWREGIEYDTFDEMFKLDDLNELVNFYFEVTRENEQCPFCEGSNYNPETKQLSDDWYDFAGTGRKWSNKLTQDEVDNLVREGRLDVNGPDGTFNISYSKEEESWMGWKRTDNGSERVKIDAPEIPSADTVNAAQGQRGSGFMSHDGINHYICVEYRAKKLGIWGSCEECDCEGYQYVEEEAKVSLQLWILHPRKGCSRGVYIKNIEQDDLPAVFDYLNEAAQRNAARFAKIPHE